MNLWLGVSVLAAALVGMVLPLQALINARLGALTQGALFASFVSFLVGTLALGSVLLLSRPAWPGGRALLALPAWVWLGGVIGAVFVFCGTLLVPRLGAAGLICLVVFGQVTGSLVLDHFGVLAQARPVDPTRIAGALLVCVGALLVVRPWQTG